MRLKHFFFLAAVALIVVVIAMSKTDKAFADNGGITINVKDELGNNLESVTVSVQCAGGSPNGLGATDSSGNLTRLAAAIPPGAGCNVDDEGITVIVSKDGYVGQTAVQGANYQTDAQNTYTITGVQFSHKVVVVDELGNSLTPTTVTAGLSDVSCTISGNSAYCPVIVTDDDIVDETTAYSIAKDGYVTAVPNLAGNRAAVGSAQQVVTLDASTGLDFGFKVTGVADELSNALTSVTVDTGNSFGTSCTESGSAWYCAVPLANTGVAIQTTKSGYITYSGISFDADRTAAGNAQQTKAVTGVPFRLKVVVSSDGGTALSGATVTHGGTSPAGESANSYYFTTTASGAIAASKTSYTSLSTAVDTGLASVSTNATTQTVITLTGTTPYTGADPVGTSVTGSGLVVPVVGGGGGDDEEEAAGSGISSSGSVSTLTPVTPSAPGFFPAATPMPVGAQNDAIVRIFAQIRELLIQLFALYGLTGL